MNTNPLLVFEQFGFILEKKDEKNAEGTCPFCHETGHFGIKYNEPNKDWHCFKCGRGGGYAGFLKTIVAESQGFQLTHLAESRGISAETLEAMKIGIFNSLYTIPVFADDGETILNIKIYDGDSFKNTAGCSSAIYGLWAMPVEYETIYLAEGEWDTLAMMDIMNDERAAVLGVPGAGTNLKPEILNLFIGKSVYLLYDHDDAGRAGREKTMNALMPIASEIRILKWPEGTKDGWDVRDVYNTEKSADKALAWIHEHSVLAEQKERGVQTPEIGGEHVSHLLIYEIFGKHFKLSDSPKYDQKSTDIYDIIFGVVFANRLPGSPVWLYLVAPPGGFKTEPLLALAGGKLIEMHESVTPPALISGQTGGVDPSLIPQWNGRLVIFKEWDRVLGLPEFERKEILSILRGGFDGVCGRTFGNGVRRTINSTFGIIAATTPINEQFTEETAAVGERFITWRNWISEDFEVRYKHIKKAMDNVTRENEIRKECGGICKRVLLSGYKTIPNCSDEYKDKSVHGIIVQMPLPQHIDAKLISRYISPLKDIEAVHPENMGEIVFGTAKILPCTAAACMELLNSVPGLELYGKEAVIVGHSEIVGKPLALLLLNKFVTVTVCHIATGQRGTLPEFVKKAEILIVAVGKAGIIKGGWIKEGAIVIDVGINRVEGKIVGDVEFDKAVEKASYITPVPGGVGPITVAILMRNAVEAFKQQQ